VRKGREGGKGMRRGGGGRRGEGGMRNVEGRGRGEAWWGVEGVRWWGFCRRKKNRRKLRKN